MSPRHRHFERVSRVGEREHLTVVSCDQSHRRLGYDLDRSVKAAKAGEAETRVIQTLTHTVTT